MLAVTDVQEFERWRIFDMVEPIGDVRSDLLAAMICTAVSALSGKTISPEKLLPKWSAWADEYTFVPDLVAESELIRQRFRDAAKIMRVEVIEN